MTYIEKAEQLDFRVVLRQDGNIELKFLSGNQERFSVICSPEQIGTIATGLLSAVQGSGHLVSAIAQQPQTGVVTLNAAIPVQNWYFADIGTQGQKALIVEIGKTKIGFVVHNYQMRELGRTIVAASWKTGTAQASLTQLFREFGAELRFWLLLRWSRVTESAQRSTNKLSTRFLGQSFRSFYTVLIAPGLGAPKYPPFRKCIYCGEEVYSRSPFVRRHPLGAEHIVAEGLGGTLELPEASCQECEKATGAVVEGDVLGRTMKAIRVHLRLKKSGSGPLPKELPLQATIFGEQKTIKIPIEEYPIVFAMYAYGPPNIDAADGMPIMTGASFVRIKHDERLLFQKYGIGAFATAYLDNVMMCRMLAKIGHALAVAELGLKNFRPLLVDLIRTGTDRRLMRFVGGASKSATVPPNTLHCLTLGFQKIKKATYVVAHVQLFASYGGPTYAVIVGESLESSGARFKRVLSSRISRMLAR